MKAISFSVFGSHPMYLEGAVENAKLAPKFYPDWKAVFYVSASAENSIKDRLLAHGAEVRSGDPAIKNEMFWRFLISDDPSVDAFIVRDTDSRLSEREAKAVAEWMESDCQFSSLRDHPDHTLPLGGGLWGGKGIKLGMAEKIASSGLASRPYGRESAYGLDQIFLTDFVWPEAKKSLMAHDSCNRWLYPESFPFPDGCKFGDWRFVGEIYDENGVPNPFHWQQRINHMTND